jgi:hypothetical protein
MNSRKSKLDAKASVRTYESRAVTNQEADVELDRILGLWSDGEAEKITADIVAAIGKEPQDVVESNYYDTATGQLKIERISGRKHMQSRLQEIAAQYHFDVHQLARPSPGQLVKRLKSIESAAHRMLAALGIEQHASDALEAITPSDLRYALQGQAALMAEKTGGFRNNPPQDFSIGGHSYVDWSPQAQLRDVIVGICQLQAWARDAGAAQSNKQRNHKAKGHQGDLAVRMVIQELFGLWIDCYHAVPKLSRNSVTGAPTGRFFRFVKAFCAALGVSATDEALGSRIGRMLSSRQKLIARRPQPE